MKKECSSQPSFSSHGLYKIVRGIRAHRNQKLCSNQPLLQGELRQSQLVGAAVRPEVRVEAAGRQGQVVLLESGQICA